MTFPHLQEKIRSGTTIFFANDAAESFSRTSSTQRSTFLFKVAKAYSINKEYHLFILNLVMTCTSLVLFTCLATSICSISERILLYY